MVRSAEPDVLQVSKFYYPYVGGIEQVVRTLARRLPAEGPSVRVLAARTRGLGGEECVEGVPVTRATSLGTVASVPVAPAFPVRLRQLGRDADVVHYHLPNPLAVGAHYLSSPDAPVIVTYHSDIVRQERARELYRPLLDRFLDHADRILVTSPRLLDHSEVLSPHAGKCTVVPLSIDPETYRPAESAADGGVREAGEDGDWSGGGDDDERGSGSDPGHGSEHTVLFVGRLNYYKGVEYLIDAMRSVEADATLVVVGDGDRREALERRARERGVDDRVRFPGKVPDEELHDWYEAADVFVLPSVEPSEAFGVVQLEAMAYRTPVVNTDLPTGVPWVSRDGETGLTVPPRDADALADAVDRLLADPDLRERYGRRGRERVETEFTHEATVSRVAEVYRELDEG